MSMRSSFIAVAVVVGTVFVVGCSQMGQSTSPTAPSSVSSVTSSSAGSASQNLTRLTDHTVPPDESFTDTNPCTGSLTTITFHYVKFIYHENLDATGGGHFTITSVIEITTGDGFSGRVTRSMAGTFGPGHSGIEEQKFTLSATLGDGSGQRVVVHFTEHVVFKDGVPVVEHNRDSAECLGKPVA